MTTFIIFVSLILLVVVAAVAYLFYRQNKFTTTQAKTDLSNDHLSNITALNWKTKVLLIVSLALIIFSFSAPFIFTRRAINDDFNFLETGPIGDTIGGLMNPFITISGVIVTGLAFYIQYRANILQRELFKEEQNANQVQLQQQINHQNRQNQIQQFESQFYEVLRLHRENVTEMVINGYDFEETLTGLQRYEKATEGRKLFVVMQTELECILSIYTTDRKLNHDGFQKCYAAFFWGIEEFERSYPEESVMANVLKAARKQHQNPDLTQISKNIQRKNFSANVRLRFNYKPFSGHASRLAHYFRHLYLAVKSVANSNVVTDYDERMKYLRILRAQLSNHEQIFLFYNWLSQYGGDWENDKHQFFTEYCMIHNLYYHLLFNDSFVIDHVNLLKTKPVTLRTGKMFEID